MRCWRRRSGRRVGEVVAVVRSLDDPTTSVKDVLLMARRMKLVLRGGTRVLSNTRAKDLATHRSVAPERPIWSADPGDARGPRGTIFPSARLILPGKEGTDDGVAYQYSNGDREMGLGTFLSQKHQWWTYETCGSPAWGLDSSFLRIQK